MIELEKNFITSEEVVHLTKNIVSISDLNDYFNGISFTRTDNQKGGSYDFISKEIIINYIIFLKAKSSALNKNIKLLQTIYHELYHAEQNKIITEKNNETIYRGKLLNILTFAEIIAKEVYINGVSDKFYQDNYEKFICEYHSEINSYIQSLKILKKATDKDNIIANYNKIIASYIINQYNNTYPIDVAINNINDFTYYQRNNAKLNFEINNLDELDRLKYGYPLHDKTIYMLENISDGKVLSKDFTKHLNR